MENPLVSVITPTYKRAHFLERALDSVLNQTYRNIQAVVIDDNAEFPEFRKKTEEIIGKYKNDPRVLYIQNSENLGGGLSRNVGIDACDGEYVAFLDDDDEFEPLKIETELKFMLMHNLDFCFTDLHMFDGNGNIVEHRTHRYVTDWSVDSLMKQHAVYSLTPTSTYMIKRDFLMRFGGFRKVPMGQEFMLMWDALVYAKEHSEIRFGYIPCSYIKAYLHDEGRISVGTNKINGERTIYKIKSTVKPRLSRKEIRYLDFRHHAVLAVVYFRSGMKLRSVSSFVNAFGISPADTIKEGFKLIKKI